MDTKTAKFYKNLNINISNKGLSNDELKTIVTTIVKNLNFDNYDIANIIFNLDKNYPQRKYFVNELKIYLNKKPIISKSYWLIRGYTESVAITKTKNEQSKRRSSNSIGYWIKKGFSEIEAITKVKESQSSRSSLGCSRMTDEEKRQRSIWCKEYYIKNGNTEAEAKASISKIQSSFGILCKGKIPLCNRNTRKEYYIKRGFTNEESENLVKNRQNTFSLLKCLDKYGVLDGNSKFNDRQILWQSTLNNKPIEEINEINRKKSNKMKINENFIKVPGIFYIIKISNELIKIGITSKPNISNRYSSDTIQNTNILLDLKTSLYEAFLLEQYLKYELQKFKIKPNEAVYPFGWTETFKIKEVDEIINFANSVNFNDLEEKFNKIKDKIWIWN